MFLRIGKLASSAAIVIVLATTPVWAGKNKLMLSCGGAAGMDETIISGLCDALEAELVKRDPEHRICRSEAFGTHRENKRTLILKMMRVEPHVWQGYLRWETVEAEWQAGSPIELFGMDKALGSDAYQQFIQGLLKTSDLPY